MALNLAMVTVVGRCVGAKDYEQVEYYVKKLMKTAYIAGAVVNGLVLLSMPLALNIYSLTPETAELTKILRMDPLCRRYRYVAGGLHSSQCTAGGE